MHIFFLINTFRKSEHIAKKYLENPMRISKGRTIVRPLSYENIGFFYEIACYFYC